MGNCSSHHYLLPPFNIKSFFFSSPFLFYAVFFPPHPPLFFTRGGRDRGGYEYKREDCLAALLVYFILKLCSYVDCCSNFELVVENVALESS